MPQPTTWDQSSLHAVLNHLSHQGQGSGADWLLDTGATTRLANNPGIITNPSPYTSSSSVIVSNGASLTITHISDTSFPTSKFHIRLCDIVITPNLIKKYISIRALTRQNPITVEFDGFGFSIKELRTWEVILWCDSPEDLYPLITG